MVFINTFVLKNYILEIELSLTLILCAIAFCAGFIDSIVGGGGLIQTPLSLAMLPQLPVATVIGSLKIPAFSGTALATSQYLKKLKFNGNFVIMAIVAFGAAYLGSKLLTIVNNDFMKPILFVILVLLFFYTLFKRFWTS